jgi:hypothetical protein
MQGELRTAERHGEEETQGRARLVDRRWADPSPGQVNLEAPHVLGRCRLGGAAKEACEGRDVPDIVGLGLLADPADSHVLQHAPAQRADGPLAHRGLLS